MTETLCLMLWVAAVMALLKFAAVKAPSHASWTNIDKPYYAIGLIGLVVAFLAQTPQRSRTHLLDINEIDRRGLEQMARAQPMFSGQGPLDAGVADGFYDLQDMLALARACETASHPSERCAAALHEAADIESSLIGLTAPPIQPSVAEGAAYGARYCAAVQSLARRVLGRERLVSPARQQAARELEALGQEHQTSGGVWSKAALRIRMAGGRTDSTGGQDTDFAVAVFDSQQPCPVTLGSLAGLDIMEARWANDWAAATARLKVNSAQLVDAQRAYEQRDTTPGQLETDDLASLFWPFAVALALCLKLARAWYFPAHAPR